MKKIRFAMGLSLALLTGCYTPLSGIQQCALAGAGEVYTGSFHAIAPIPNCRLPQTDAERAKINEIRPEAQALAQKNKQISWFQLGLAAGAPLLFAVILGLSQL